MRIVTSGGIAIVGSQTEVVAYTAAPIRLPLQKAQLAIGLELLCYLAVLRSLLLRWYLYHWAGGVGRHKGETRRVVPSLPEQVAAIQANTRRHAKEMSLLASVGNPLRRSHGSHSDKLDLIGVAA